MKGKSSHMSDTAAKPHQLSQAGLAVYKALLDNMQFVKKQQWSITNYLILILAALFGISRTFQPLTACEKLVESTFAVIASCYGIYLLILMQIHMADTRRRLKKIHDTCLTCEEIMILGISDYSRPFAEGTSFLIGFIGVTLISTTLVIFSMWR